MSVRKSARLWNRPVVITPKGQSPVRALIVFPQQLTNSLLASRSCEISPEQRSCIRVLISVHIWPSDVHWVYPIQLWKGPVLWDWVETARRMKHRFGRKHAGFLPPGSVVSATEVVLILCFNKAYLWFNFDAKVLETFWEMHFFALHLKRR